MRIFLIGGGSGGHITPLLAVAHELKRLKPDVQLVGICEKQAKFVRLYKEDKAIDRVFQVRAGKYRRYAGQSWDEKLLDVKTLLLNIRDVGRTGVGYIEARKLIKELKPDIMVIKGGFVGVPMGLAAAKLGVPFITHDSDSTPGLANRIISKWALRHATGMPAELYDYPKEATIYTGIPISKEYKKLNGSLKATYRDQLKLGSCRFIVTVTGGSQGGSQLNSDMLKIIPTLMQKYPGLGIVHVAGPLHEHEVAKAYAEKVSPQDFQRIIVKGFTDELHVCTGAADVVVSRASATSLAELSLQSQAVIVVPGMLADGHQEKNAGYLDKLGAVKQVKYSDALALQSAIEELLDNPVKRADLADKLHLLAKPQAARDLAQLALGLADKK